MNILIYTHYNNPNPIFGGIERATDILARFLLNKDVKVFYLSRFNRESEDTYQMPCLQYYLPDQEIGTLRNKSFILDLLDKHDIDIIINQMGFFNGIKKDELPSKVRVISVVHDSLKAIFQSKKKYSLSKIKSWISSCLHVRTLFKNSDTVIFFSKSHINDTSLFYKIPLSKTAIIPNFNTYEDVILLPNKKNEILYVGRLVHDCKRVDRLLQAWSGIAHKHLDWRVDIVGDGPAKNDLIDFTKRNKIPRVSFLGQKDPASNYQTASILCLTSSYESFGLVITEGMQHGVVPIVFNSYAMASEIVTNGKNGFLVEPFDIDCFANKISRLINNKNLRIDFAEDAQKEVRKFSSESVGRLWLNIIEETCNK